MKNLGYVTKQSGSFKGRTRYGMRAGFRVLAFCYGNIPLIRERDEDPNPEQIGTDGVQILT